MRSSSKESICKSNDRLFYHFEPTVLADIKFSIKDKKKCCMRADKKLILLSKFDLDVFLEFYISLSEDDVGKLFLPSRKK